MKKEVQLKFEKSQDQNMDIFTKPLKFEDFRGLRMLIGVKKSSLRKHFGNLNLI